MMEGPFGLVSSRCLPRWPWSVFVVSYMAGAAHGGGRGYRSHSGGATGTPSSKSTDLPGACSRLTKQSCREAQPYNDRHYDESSEVEGQRKGGSQRDVHHSVGESNLKSHEGALRRPQTPHRKYESLHGTHRHVENAVDNADEGRNQFGAHQDGPRGVKNGPKGRSWSCFPNLKQLLQALVGSKDTLEPNELMSYQERLTFHDKWSGSNRSFEIFLLKAPDCPDDIKTELSKDAHQRSHEAQDLEAQHRQSVRLIAGGPRYVNPPLPTAKQQQQKSSRSSSPASCQTVGKPEGPPGKAALRSLTPEGARSRSRSPTRGGVGHRTELPSVGGNGTRCDSPSLTHSPSAGPRGSGVLRSRPDSPARQRTTPRPRISRTGSPKLPKEVARWDARSQQWSSRVNRCQSPVRTRRITTRPSSSPTTLPHPLRFAYGDDPELEPEHELRILRPCGVRIHSSLGISPRNSSRASFQPRRTQSRTRGRPIPSPGRGDVHDKPGSPCNRPAENEIRISQKGPNLSGLGAISSPNSPGTAQITVMNATPKGNFNDTENHSRVVENSVKAKNRLLPVVATVATDAPRAATSHIKLLDSATHNSVQEKSSRNSLEEAADRPQYPPVSLETRVRVFDPSNTEEVCSSSNSNPEGRTRDLEHVDAISNNTNTGNRELEEATGRPDGSPPSVISFPKSVLEGQLRESAAHGHSQGSDRVEGSPTNAAAVRKYVDLMAIDVLRQLKEQPPSQRPARRRAYEVEIPTGVWKLNFIPNEVPSLGGECAAERGRSSSRCSQTSSSSSGSGSRSSGYKSVQGGCF